MDRTGLPWFLCWLVATPLISQEAAPLAGGDRLLSLDGYDELWRIGGAAGEEWAAFGSIGTVAFTPEGGLVVHDVRGTRVILVNPEGGLVRELAGIGDGPGDFRLIRSVLVGRDGEFVVYDGAKRAFMLHDSGGDYTSSISVGTTNGEWLSPVLLPSHRPGEAFRVVYAEPDGSRDIQRVTISDGELQVEHYYKTWRSPRQVLPDSDAYFQFDLLRGEASVTEGFFPVLRADRLPEGGLAVVDSSGYEVKIVDAMGRVSRVIRRSIEPVSSERADAPSGTRSAARARSANRGIGAAGLRGPNGGYRRHGLLSGDLGDHRPPHRLGRRGLGAAAPE